MKKFKIPLSTDLFFCFIALFCLFYAIFIKSGLTLIGSTLLSAVISLIISSIIAVILIKFFDKKGATLLEEELKQNLLNYLTFLPRKELLNYFKQAFNKDGVFLENFNNGLLYKDKQLYIYPIFNASSTTKQNLVEAYRSKEENTLIVLSGSYLPECYTITNNVTLYDIGDVYLTLKTLDALPTLTATKIDKKKRLISTLKGLFNKKYAKFFFISGAITLIFSTLTFFKTYYIIVGAILLIISALCKFFAPATATTKGINLK